MKLQKMQVRLMLSMAVLCCLLSCYFYFGITGYTFASFIFLSIGILLLGFIPIYLASKKGKKWAIWVKRILLSLICIGMLSFFMAEAFVISYSVGEDEKAAEYIIVLGAGLNGTQPSTSLLHRLKAAAEYLEKHPKATAIVSGGRGPGEYITEAEAMETWLCTYGIAPERIIKEEKSTSTLENIAFSKAIIELAGNDISGPIGIVSSEYHLYRAQQYAKSLGVNTFGIPGKTNTPSLKLNYFIREGAGVLYMWILGFDEETVVTQAEMYARIV